MKKFIVGILVICLIIGMPLIAMDALAGKNGKFNIPMGYKKLSIDLSEKSRNNETVFTKELKEPTKLNLRIQGDTKAECNVTVTCDTKIIGTNMNEETYTVRNMTGNSYISHELFVGAGKYTIKVTNQKTEGQIVIGYREKTIETSEYERLKKIDSGHLDNPPESYEKIYSADLSGKNISGETIYTLKLDHAQKVGISVYTSATKGNVSVDFIGQNSSYIGLVYPNIRNICDQLENTYQRGIYDISVTSTDADGELYIFLKK